MIELKNVTKRFGSIEALSGVSIEIKPGEILGFLGPNGAGKTTTMRIITGYLTPTEGEVLVDGEPFLRHALKNKKRLGYLPEQNPLYPDLKVSEYLQYIAAMRLIPRGKIRSRISETVKTCALTPVIDQPIATLSKGFRQRVGLAQALIHNPDILLLDEPTAGLDPNQIVEIRRLIKEIGQEKTIIISTHILPEVSAICDRAIIINKGKVAAQGSIKELEHQAQGTNKVELTIKGSGSPNFIQELSALPGVRNVESFGSDLPGEQDFLVQTERDMREDLFRLAVKKNVILIKLAEKSASLEDIFREITLSEKQI